jgi:hypothetical protein
MAQKVFVKTEKCLACDLKPGELFIRELPDPEYFGRELNRAHAALSVSLRTNVEVTDAPDREMLVYRVHIVIIDRDDPLPPRVDPHKPPGVKDERRTESGAEKRR